MAGASLALTVRRWSMPDWLEVVLKYVLAPTFVAAVGGWVFKVMSARNKATLDRLTAEHKVKMEGMEAEHRLNRENRTDQVGVLQNHIKQLYEDLAVTKREERARYREVLKMKDDCSTALAKMELAEAAADRCHEDHAECKKRVAELQAQREQDQAEYIRRAGELERRIVALEKDDYHRGP